MFCIKIINCSYWLALWRDYHLYSFLITLTFFFVAENYYIFVEVWHDVYFIHEWKWFKSETYKVSGCLSSYCGPVIWQYWFAWIGISLVGPSECLYRSSIGLSELSKKPLFVVRSLKERLVMAMLLVLNENFIRGYLLKEWKNFLLF